MMALPEKAFYIQRTLLFLFGNYVSRRANKSELSYRCALENAFHIVRSEFRLVTWYSKQNTSRIAG